MGAAAKIPCLCMEEEGGYDCTEEALGLGCDLCWKITALVQPGAGRIVAACSAVSRPGSYSSSCHVPLDRRVCLQEESVAGTWPQFFQTINSTMCASHLQHVLHISKEDDCSPCKKGSFP